jgi:hypothetical protein
MSPRSHTRRVAAASAFFAWPLAAPAAEDAHRSADTAKHRRIAQAHVDAGRCLQFVSTFRLKPVDCDGRLEQACQSIAVSKRCGPHSHAAEGEDLTRRIADHQALSAVRVNAAQCPEPGLPLDDCSIALGKRCGTCCGVRH